jgi:hypothetical protein
MKRTTGRAAAFGVVVTAALAAGMAYGSAGADGVIRACAGPTGQLRAVDGAADCRPSEQALEWIVTDIEPPELGGPPGSFHEALGFGGARRIEIGDPDVPSERAESRRQASPEPPTSPGDQCEFPWSARRHGNFILVALISGSDAAP